MFLFYFFTYMYMQFFDTKNVGFQVLRHFYLDTSIIANNGDTAEIIGQLSLHEQRKHIPNDKWVISIFHRLLESISMGGGGTSS